MGTTVGQRIEAIAREKGLPSGKALAELFGVQYETMRKWRTGDIAPNRERVKVIAEVLGVPPVAFLIEQPEGAIDPLTLSGYASKVAERFSELPAPTQKALFPFVLDSIRLAARGLLPPSASRPEQDQQPIADRHQSESEPRGKRQRGPSLKRTLT